MKIALILAASLLPFSAPDAQAAAKPDVSSITVGYADLDLGRTPGIAVLYQRIKAAAHQLCKPAASETLVSKRAYETCFDEAVSTAVARVDLPMLSDYVARQSGAPVDVRSERVATR